MPVIDKHKEEGAVEEYVVPVKPRRRHCHVFYKITRVLGAV